MNELRLCFSKLPRKGVTQQGIIDELSDHQLSFCTRNISRINRGKHKEIKYDLFKHYLADLFFDGLRVIESLIVFKFIYKLSSSEVRELRINKTVQHDISLVSGEFKDYFFNLARNIFRKLSKFQNKFTLNAVDQHYLFKVMNYFKKH